MEEGRAIEPQYSVASNFLKRRWNLILLCLIIIFGFYLRSYHIDYPVIGYHNWKETHYLTEARNFARDGFFKHGIFVPEYDYYQGTEGKYGEHPDSFPLTSIVVAGLFKIFGQSLRVARLSSVLFSVATIVVMYVLVRRLFKREDFALVAAFITATLPLFVFFGRQVQLEPYAMFFMLVSGYFFLCWKENPNMKNMLLTTSTFTIGFVSRYDHFTIIFPMLVMFPYKRFVEKQYWKQFLVGGLVLLLIPAWLIYNKALGKALGVPIVPEGMKPSLLLNSEWWKPIIAYLRDNYTMFGVLLAGMGLLFLIFFYLKNKSDGNKFLFGFVLSIIPWLIISAKYLEGHAYHQFPASPVFVLLESMAIIGITSSITSLFKIKFLKAVGIIALAGLLYFGFGIVEGEVTAKNRLFDTQFLGLDVAGSYINEHSKPGDKIMHSSGQGYGLMWYADRKGFKLPKDAQELADKEANGARWLFIYQWGFSIMQKSELWDKIKESYGLAQLAFQQTQQGNVPLYFLMKKGGSFNESLLNDMLKNRQPNRKEYELTRGKVIIWYINFE
ncbi:MAG: glycosyltransferase family 39 protein [Candidatus Woesearchaeota archaeon]